MELKVGQKFSRDKYNTYTMTARNSTVNEVWEVIEILNETDVKAVLLSTNEFMYGGGVKADFNNIKEYQENHGLLYFH